MSDRVSPWHGRRVLVTGSTGFLGGAVARELLACGADVVGLVRDRASANVFAREQAEDRFHVVYGRAEDTFRLHSAMAVYEVSAVFHLASTSVESVRRAAQLYSDRVPVVIARPLQQLTIARTSEPRETCLSVARFGELFGPGDRKLARVVPSTSIELLTGDGTSPVEGPARDFVFIRDAARACLQVAEDFAARGPGDYSFRGGWLLTDRQMCAAIRDVFTGRSATLPGTAQPTNPLPWEPQFTFTEAINGTLAWYRELLRAGQSLSARKAA